MEIIPNLINHIMMEVYKMKNTLIVFTAPGLAVAQEDRDIQFCDI